ncbi:MAG TPA: hypothetical protein VKA95_15230 [Nitrososphaeraceae archaeon]|nr:hypothetical protein [Nitrososphaeraceae archaeon]
MPKLCIKVFKQEVAMITSEYFKLLDFWFYTVGVNVWPADSWNKKARQDGPISSDEYEAIKKEGAYIRRAAVIIGKLKDAAAVTNYQIELTAVWSDHTDADNSDMKDIRSSRSIRS